MKLVFPQVEFQEEDLTQWDEDFDSDRGERLVDDEVEFD